MTAPDLAAVARGVALLQRELHVLAPRATLLTILDALAAAAAAEQALVTDLDLDGAYAYSAGVLTAVLDARRHALAELGRAASEPSATPTLRRTMKQQPQQRR